jgi:hypothetical protein
LAVGGLVQVCARGCNTFAGVLLRKALEALPALAARAFLRSLSISGLKRGAALSPLLGGLRSLCSSGPVLFSYPDASDSGGSTTLLRQCLLRLRIFLLRLSLSPEASHFCRFDSAIISPSTSDGIAIAVANTLELDRDPASATGCSIYTSYSLPLPSSRLSFPHVYISRTFLGYGKTISSIVFTGAFPSRCSVSMRVCCVCACACRRVCVRVCGYDCVCV